MQPRQQFRRIDVCGIGPGREGVRTDEGDPAEFRPVTARLRRLIRGDQIDLGGPWRLRQRGGFVPIIAGLMEKNLESCAGRDHQDAAWIIHDRHPGLEMGVYLVRVVLIIQELHGRRARMYDQCIETAGRKGLLRAPHEHL